LALVARNFLASGRPVATEVVVNTRANGRSARQFGSRTSMTKRRPPPDPPGPKRIPPGDDLSEAVERMISRRQLQIEAGDIVIRRERVPRLNPRASAAMPWRFRVLVSPEPGGLVFTSFPHAASEAEQMAARRRSRVVYVEDDRPTLLADYRR
jgi:hypothetical protein